MNAGYTPVSLDTFFDSSEKPEDLISTGIIVLTPHQEELYNNLLAALEKNAPDRVEKLTDRLADIKQLAQALAAFPSLLERATLNTTVRTPEALVESLISYQEDGDTLLHMPSKAILGKGFLVAKIHTFYSMSKLARDYAGMDEKTVKKYSDETVSMMFTLMAEDVYLNLIKDSSLSMDLRRELANSLIILWEHRSDQNISDIAPVLQSVWSARRKIAPAFGTMMGTSELLLVSIQMDEQWTSFIKERLGDNEVSQAMEEFLFGISYEQIIRLREILREQGIKAIGRDEVSAQLGERVKTDISLDYRDFYLLYTVRRDNARARSRLHLPGPTKTLEDFFIRFIMEKNSEKQKNDAFAKQP
ncbi:MAG: hypothetical protein IIU30_05155 [Treponema sp.]|nr:hypothetical protein [Treponema sp.]